MGPKAVGTCRLRRKRNRAPIHLCGRPIRIPRQGVSDQIADPYKRRGSEVQETAAEESKAQPGSGRSLLSGKRQWHGKGKGRGTQPEEEEEEERFAYSMEEDEEDEPPNIPEQEDLDLNRFPSIP